jgi:hypothetical protein
MGQVSLPVLSRKGKYDDWNYTWTSFNNYSLLFNEDLFIKRFFFLFFMYGISSNKHFPPIFFKKNTLKQKTTMRKHHNLTNSSDFNIATYFKTPPHNKFYVSKIFLCRYEKWVYMYLYIYSVTNIRIKKLANQKKLKTFNKQIFYHAYLRSKIHYLVGPTT